MKKFRPIRIVFFFNEERARIERMLGIEGDVSNGFGSWWIRKS